MSIRSLFIKGRNGIGVVFTNQQAEALAEFLDAAKKLSIWRPTIEDIKRVEPDGGVLTEYWRIYDNFEKEFDLG